MDLSRDITIGGVVPSMVKVIEFKIRGNSILGLGLGLGLKG